jgi:hypothetical protein
MPRPPSTGITAPVTYPASGPARKATAPATSSADAYRPSGTAPMICALRSGDRTAVMSLSTNPGATRLAVMLREPSSRASDLASPTRPDLDAA